MMTRGHHYEIWESTFTHADVVGHSDTLVGALMLYLRIRRARRGRTVKLLVHDEPAAGGV
jgi:hypothetical protein